MRSAVEEGDGPFVYDVRKSESREFVGKREAAKRVKGCGKVKRYEGGISVGGKESGCMMKDGDNSRSDRANGAENIFVR